MVAPPRGGVRRPQTAPERSRVSTRKLIIAALVTGLAILVAFAVQVALFAH